MYKNTSYFYVQFFRLNFYSILFLLVYQYIVVVGDKSVMGDKFCKLINVIRCYTPMPTRHPLEPHSYLYLFVTRQNQNFPHQITITLLFLLAKLKLQKEPLQLEQIFIV